MTLTQAGSTLNGTTQTVSSAGPFSRQATAAISGQLNGLTVTFTESNQNGSVNNNCYWRGTLTYNPIDESLIGTFENIVNGNYCSAASNGRVELYRIALKNGTTFCKSTPARLTVTGKNIRWYSSESKTNLLATGNTYTPRLNETTTFYVTQTLNQAESPAVPITVTVTEPIFKFAIANAGCAKNNGSIQVIASDATNWQYSVNAGAFQASPLFTNLAPGSYTIVAKDTDGCQAAHTGIVTTTA
ncbi:MAG: gliding motility-associated C-terminal domain-containing protein, partial [Cytophagaceae bacterium]